MDQQVFFHDMSEFYLRNLRIDLPNIQKRKKGEVIIWALYSFTKFDCVKYFH